jgi:hypothetical protein
VGHFGVEHFDSGVRGNKIRSTLQFLMKMIVQNGVTIQRSDDAPVRFRNRFQTVACSRADFLHGSVELNAAQ